MAGRLHETKAWILAGLIFAGSLLLALVVPVVALWGVSMLGRGRMESVYIALLACPAALVAGAALLGRLNQAFKETTGRRDDEVLGMALAAAVLVAIVTLIVLFVLGGPDAASHGPWPA